MSIRPMIQGFGPLNTSSGSWKRFSEGLFLYTHGMPLYDNDIFHQSPLLLPVFALIPPWCHPHVFVALDLAIAVALYSIAHRQPHLEPLAHLPTSPPLKSLRQPTYTDGHDIHDGQDQPAHDIVLVDRCGGGLAWTPTLVSLAFLFNPLSILSCLAMDLGAIERFSLAVGAATASHGDSIWSSLLLAVAFQHGGGLHTLCFIPILALIQRRATQLSGMALIPGMTIQVGAWLGVCAMLYVQIMGLDVATIAKATIGFGLHVTDLAPNIGVWWYFLQEVFEHFRDLFVFVFQAHVLLYIVPVLMRFGKELPIFSLTVYLGVTATLRAYPSVGDYALWFAFIPLYANTWKYYRYSFLSLTLFLFTSLLFPTMYLLYSHLHSGNANFPYALTLLVCAAATMMQSDVLHGMLVRTHSSTVKHEVARRVQRAVLEMDDESGDEDVHEVDAGVAADQEKATDGGLRNRGAPASKKEAKQAGAAEDMAEKDKAEVEPFGDYPSVVMYFEE
ncbi:GPI transamidase subunit PIG-U-domain-containing protein [Catenaria anguillulae PL171]|uniref:GPI transamidase subunit PIG-U-domain-containing protein n=1 Tax=Catenaria anguillulae PL171 TaxID=765915 RepID=A0A1Y2HE11_9FUNG|nr:GPI transamidase subunit PIG-U-domain-containing protein [Catenaria anguillulae PL171]